MIYCMTYLFDNKYVKIPGAALGILRCSSPSSLYNHIARVCLKHHPKVLPVEIDAKDNFRRLLYRPSPTC